MFEQPLSKEFCSTNSWQKPGMARGSHGGASGCSRGQVVTVNCPVLSSAMFLCGIGCFGVILLHCSVVEMQRNSFRNGTCVFLGLEGEIKPKWKAKIVLGFTTWVWRVCPKHGANTAFCWVQLLYPKQQQLQWGQAIPASSVGSFFCFCYGWNLVKVSGLNWATSTEFSQHISLCNVKHDWMLNPDDGYPILAFLYSERIV